MNSSRTVIFGALVAIGITAGAFAYLSRPEVSTPVTVYLTPT
jgi:hypothetical protein